MNGNNPDDSIEYLNALNKRLKESYPTDCRNAVIRRQYGMSQLCINTRGCSAGMTGSCLYCNYPHGHNVDLIGASSAVKNLLDSMEPSDKSLLVGSSGSILDPSEIPDDILNAILEELSALKEKNIIFETRIDIMPLTVLDRIAEHLKGNKITIEFGLESSNPLVLRYCLNKKLNLPKIAETMRTIRSKGFGVTANVLVGTPFLAPQEQIRDSIDSIKWAIENGADDVVLFPVNIRHGTVLKELCDIGAYRPTEYDAIVSVLKWIDCKYLDRISLSWSDPEEVDDPVIHTHPRVNNAGVFRFFREFMSEQSLKGRSTLLSDYVRNINVLKPTQTVNYEKAISLMCSMSTKLMGKNR